MLLQISGSVCMFRQLPAIPVCRDLPYIFLRSLFQILDVISNRQNDLIRYETFIYQIQCQLVDHFLYHDLRLLEIIWTMQYLSRTHTVIFGLIRLHICDRAWLPSPCMVNQKFCIYTKHPIQ